MATPHINAEMGDFADVVLMPGDPLRAKHIAETFLENVREVNNVRGMLGFTGTYKGRKISVMGHGMGIPSCSIYTKELITDFGVKKIIRVGSCGAVRMDVKLRDVVIGMGACTDSKVNRIRFKDHDFAAIADFDMVRNAVDAAKALGVDARVGNLFSADLFYSPDGEMFDVMEKYGVLGVEMEAAGIYGVAAEFGAKALTICTVSDHIRTHEQTTAAERQTTFNDMIKIAREELTEGGYNIGRVIARPFIGDKAGNFQRTGNRHDLAVEPPAPTVLQKLVDEKQGHVVSVGKIADIYANCGITKKVKATGLDALFDATLKEMKEAGDKTIVFTNFVDFDSSWGHRRDIAGYAAGLELFDRRLPELMELVGEDDILILTADHGCDPSWTGTDHTREHIPVLIYGPKVKPGSLGHRETFADIGQTLATYFGTSPMDYGKNML